MASSETKICNQALGIIGSLRINNLSDNTESSPQAIQCRLHYEPTRDALLRSHNWRFAVARAVLSEDTTSPDFEYSNQFILPTDFLALRSVWGGTFTGKKTAFSYAIEGQRLLTNDSSLSLKYTRKVTDAAQFDPLFIKVLAAQLADEFIGPLAGGDKRIQDKIDRRLAVLLPRARVLSRMETDTVGRADLGTWNNARASLGGRIDSQMGS